MSSHSAESTFGGGSRRLPPNPRRNKVPASQRKRVRKACDSCNVRRVKCSGTQPCLQCASSSRKCEYPPENPASASPIQQQRLLEERCTLLERCLADAIPSREDRETLLSKLKKIPVDALDIGSIAIPEDEQEKTGDGRILQDLEGHTRYLGESSGAAFIDRLREFVAKVLPLLSDKSRVPLASTEDFFASLLGRYHTNDSKPLMLPDVDPFHLPEAAEVKKMLAVFTFHGQYGVEGGIYYWGDLTELADQTLKYIESPDPNDEAHFLANLNAILALACQYDPSIAPSWEMYPGLTYFARAKYLLVNPLEDARLSSMRTLCLMGHYLLGIYRRDAAYLYIGLAGRIAISHGLHKGWMIDGRGVAGEQIKREFWNTYILDRLLSCLMGRPAIIPAEAVDVAYPADIPNSNLPPAAGLRAHAELSTKMDQIINTLYGSASAGRSIFEVVPAVTNLIHNLKSWMDNLPPFLRNGHRDGQDRACITLHMMHNQLFVLSSRPFLFVAAKQAVAVKYMPSRHHQQPSNIYLLMCCTKAARENAQLSRRLLASNQASFFSTLDYHHAFTTSIVLLLATLVPEIAVPEDMEDVDFLSEYLLEAGGTGNESATDCASIVMEFRAVVSRLLSDSPSQPTQNPMETPNNLLFEQGSNEGLSSISADGRYSNGQSWSTDAELSLEDQGPESSFQLFEWLKDTSFDPRSRQYLYR